MIDDLAKLKLASLVISGHAPTERKQMLYQKCADKGIKAWWQPDFGDTNTIGLAGQIDYEKAYDKSYPPLQDPQNHCRFLVEEQAVIYFNGDLVPCCIDYNGCGVFGNIFNENVLELTPKANKLCQTCPGHPGNVI
jgi:hypothetical protein